MSLRNLFVLIALVFLSFTTPFARADILATAFFTGQILRFNSGTGTFSTFAQINPASDPFPGLSGIYVDNASNLVYATARQSNRLYQFNAMTGSVVNVLQLANGSAPTGITAKNGLIYIANNGGNSVSVFNSSLALQNTINLPDLDPGTPAVDNNLPSGLAITGDQLLISTSANAGIFAHDLQSGILTVFNNINPPAYNQIAVTGNGNVVVGSVITSSSVFVFDPIGNASSEILIDGTISPQPALGYASFDATSPSGVAVDESGNIIVATLGRTNPFNPADNFQSNGGLFKFSPAGTLLETYGVNLTPLSSVAVITAVPEPTSLVAVGAIAAGAWYRKKRRQRK